jgi:hypothetical protein
MNESRAGAARSPESERLPKKRSSSRRSWYADGGKKIDITLVFQLLVLLTGIVGTFFATRVGFEKRLSRLEAMERVEQPVSDYFARSSFQARLNNLILLKDEVSELKKVVDAWKAPKLSYGSGVPPWVQPDFPPSPGEWVQGEASNQDLPAVIPTAGLRTLMVNSNFGIQDEVTMGRLNRYLTLADRYNSLFYELGYIYWPPGGSPMPNMSKIQQGMSRDTVESFLKRAEPLINQMKGQLDGLDPALQREIDDLRRVVKDWDQRKREIANG